MKRIAINTGGGDAPGLNAVIRAVALSALARGWEVLGIRRGYQGLLDDDPNALIHLDRNAVRGIVHVGGTILGTSNRNDPFNYPAEIDGKKVPVDRSEHLVRRFHDLGIDALVALGGDGSMRIARSLLARGLPRVIGVPKTIDNDLRGTNVTFGFATAVETTTEALDRLHSTAQSHQRVIVVEVMGRHAGWIALYAGIAGGADVILMPEIPYDLERIYEKIRQRYQQGSEFAIVVVAEGAKEVGHDVTYKLGKDAFKEHAVLGGIAERLARQIEASTGCESRSVVLGHLQRGGSPIGLDRLLAQRMGCAAVRFVAETDQSGMLAEIGGQIRLLPLDDVVGGIRNVDLHGDAVCTGRDLGICFGDERAGTFSAVPASERPPSNGAAHAHPVL